MIGEAVEYVDERGQSHKALVTNTFGTGPDYPPDTKPGVNVVFVSEDEAQSDQYGRQIERRASVVHESKQAAHGNFWREA